MSDQENKPQSEQENQNSLPENDLEKVVGGMNDIFSRSGIYLDPSIVKADPLPQGILPPIVQPLPDDPKLKP